MAGIWAIEKHVCAALKVDPETLQGRGVSLQGSASKARKIVAWIARQRGHQHCDIGGYFEMSEEASCMAAKKVERDDSLLSEATQIYKAMK